MNRFAARSAALCEKSSRSGDSAEAIHADPLELRGQPFALISTVAQAMGRARRGLLRPAAHLDEPLA
jgi:hypothetical protein